MYHVFKTYHPFSFPLVYPSSYLHDVTYAGCKHDLIFLTRQLFAHRKRVQEQVIDGIKYDSVELVRAALRHKFSNPEERLEAAGPAGAPFSFANAVRV